MFLKQPLTFCSAPSPPGRLPKLSWLPGPWGPDGGRPPLTVWGGIGEGDRAGAGLLTGVPKLELCEICGTLLAMAGEPLALMEPKLMFGRGEGPAELPFAM
jgi:hypothetical protein